MKTRVRSTVLLICLLTCQISLGLQISISFTTGPSQTHNIGSSMAASYTPSAPIEIISDADFAGKATVNGWNGNGSLESPYIITDLNITSTSDIDVLVSISDTTVYFSLEENLFVGGSICVKLVNVTNGEVSGNMIRGAAGPGVFLGLCVNCSVSENIMRSNGGQGILADYSEFCQFSSNNITDNAQSGFHLRDSPNNTVLANVICNNTDIGLILGHSLNCTIEGNVIYNNSLRGISLEESSSITVVENTVYDHVDVGVKFIGSSGSCRIIGNTFYMNGFAGLRLQSGHNTVQENNFIDNGLFASPIQQIADDSEGSSFRHNFWSEWTGPDNNNDGIVDAPYIIPPINEERNVQDLTPRTSAYLNYDLHILTRPTVFFPNEHLDAGFFHGIMNVTWGQSSDTFGHAILYSVHYSIDDGESWNQIVSGLDNTFYLWNTSAVTQDLEYEIKVISECSDELVSEHFTDVAFTIREHILSTPTIVYPNGGEVFSYEIEAMWTPSSDSWNHEIFYKVYLSADEGATWEPVTDEVSEDHALLNIGYLPDGAYVLKVVTIGSCGLEAEDISDAKFTIQDINRLVYVTIGVTAFAATAIIATVYVLRRRKIV